MEKNPRLKDITYSLNAVETIDEFDLDDINRELSDWEILNEAGPPEDFEPTDWLGCKDYLDPGLEFGFDPNLEFEVEADVAINGWQLSEAAIYIWSIDEELEIDEIPEWL